MSQAKPTLSVLDLVPVSQGRSRSQALREMVLLAQSAERAGYARYWLAEHHGSTTFLSSATTVLMGQVLAATESITVASGGVMLPNHAPLVVAEAVGTLATMYPGRVEVGLGRAPGTDPVTARALRRHEADPASFVDEVTELADYLAANDSLFETLPGSVAAQTSAHDVAWVASSRARALPGEGTNPPLWILGSSVNGARVAGRLGLGFAVAAHFAPAQAEAAVMAYRSVFNGASDYAQASHPRTAAAFNVVVAPTDEEAQYLATTARAANARIVAGRPGPLDEPTSDPEAWRALAGERAAMVDDSLAYFFVGTPQRVAAQLHEMAQRWELEDIICLSFIHDAAARRRSYELLAQAW